MTGKASLTAVFLLIGTANAMADYVWEPGHWAPPRWRPGRWVWQPPRYPGPWERPQEWWWRCRPVYRYGYEEGVRCTMVEWP